MALIDGLRPRLPPRWLLRIAAGCCDSRGELRLLIRQDLAFQRAVFKGYHPAWVYQQWQANDRRFRRQRLSWVLTALLGRHVGVGHMMMGSAILTTVWLVRHSLCRRDMRGSK